MLYECLTGTVPFPRASRDELVAAHRSAPRPRVSDLRPDLGESLDEIIAIGMAIDPDERYVSATALTRAAATALGIALVDDAEIGDPGGDGPGSSRVDPAPSDDIGPTEIS
jgi:serine/threonine-protein kinase